MITFAHRKRTDMQTETIHRKPSRTLTGHTVLLCMIAFFGVVTAVNAVMIKVAISTFGGAETDSAYRSGLAYKGEEVAASAQQAMNWRVDGRLDRAASGDAVLTVDMKDARQTAVSGVIVNARLTHPVTSRLDHTITLTQMPDGTFRGQADATPGQWILTLDVMRGDNRLYRSISRLVLK